MAVLVVVVLVVMVLVVMVLVVMVVAVLVVVIARVHRTIIAAGTASGHAERQENRPSVEFAALLCKNLRCLGRQHPEDI